MDAPYFISKADLASSRTVVASLWAQGLEGLVDAVADAKYRHFYLDNPAGAGILVLLHQNATGAAVGVEGLIPRRFHVGDQAIDVATLADFVVVPEHRSLGPALTLMRSCIATSQDRFAFVYGTPNDKSRAILKRAGVRSLGSLTRYTKLIRSASFLQLRMPGWAVPLAAAAVDVALATGDVVRSWRRGARLRWSEGTSFGPEFDEIWNRRQTDLVTGERSSTTLRWRYASNSRPDAWKISLAADSTGTPFGYVVWRQREGIALVSDFFCADIERAAGDLLQSFAMHVRRFPVHRISLEYFGRPAIANELMLRGFVAREQSTIVVVEHGPASQVPRITPDAVFMTTFDRDHEE